MGTVDLGRRRNGWRDGNRISKEGELIMENTMRVIAQAGGYSVLQSMNGLVEVRKGSASYYADGKGAYEIIREIPEDDVRAELLKQWNKDMSAQSHAESNSKDSEFHG
jgi:hypothetical protein